MRTPTNPENDDIVAEFKRDLHDITEQPSGIRDWLYNYLVMASGFLMIVVALVLLIINVREFSQFVSELALSPDTAEARPNVIAVFLSVHSIKITTLWGLLGLGIGLLGVGLAFYIHNTSNRITRIYMLASEYTGRILLGAIHGSSPQQANENGSESNTQSKTDKPRKKKRG